MDRMGCACRGRTLVGIKHQPPWWSHVWPCKENTSCSWMKEFVFFTHLLILQFKVWHRGQQVPLHIGVEPEILQQPGLSSPLQCHKEKHPACKLMEDWQESLQPPSSLCPTSEEPISQRRRETLAGINRFLFHASTFKERSFLETHKNQVMNCFSFWEIDTASVQDWNVQ